MAPNERSGSGPHSDLRVCTQYENYGENISISDDVYRALKREKGDRSFSEVIESTLKTGMTLREVNGQRILQADTIDTVTDDIERMSTGTMDRIADDDL